MIRFILRTKKRDAVSGYEGEALRTLDVEVPQLEQELSVGGYGEMGYHRCILIGVELLLDSEEHDRPAERKAGGA